MRSQFIIFLLLSLMVAGASAAGSRTMEMGEEEKLSVTDNLRLPASHDMAALRELSRANQVPILLMFASEDCHYCQRLEAEVLIPMRQAGMDPDRVILRKVMMDEYDELRDFSGRQRNAESFSINRGVEVVPTVQLVDTAGNNLVPPMVGYQTPGLYSAYLEKAIDVSRVLLEKKCQMLEKSR